MRHGASFVKLDAHEGLSTSQSYSGATTSYQGDLPGQLERICVFLRHHLLRVVLRLCTVS